MIAIVYCQIVIRQKIDDNLNQFFLKYKQWLISKYLININQINMKFAFVAFALVSAVVSQDQPANLFLQASDDAIVHAYSDLLSQSDVLKNDIAFLGQLIADAETAASQIPAASPILQELSKPDQQHDAQQAAVEVQKDDTPTQDLFEIPDSEQ